MGSRPTFSILVVGPQGRQERKGAPSSEASRPPRPSYQRGGESIRLPAPSAPARPEPPGPRPRACEALGRERGRSPRAPGSAQSRAEASGPAPGVRGAPDPQHQPRGALAPSPGAGPDPRRRPLAPSRGPSKTPPAPDRPGPASSPRLRIQRPAVPAPGQGRTAARTGGPLRVLAGRAAGVATQWARGGSGGGIRRLTCSSRGSSYRSMRRQHGASALSRSSRAQRG